MSTDAPVTSSPARGTDPIGHRWGRATGVDRPKRHRLEIEGLRAVAALLVAVYHIWFGTVSGGVDVFFVVAGFMVTTTLVGHFARFGHLRLGTYFARLLSRLLPNALLVLAVVALAAPVLVPVTARADLLREVAASAVYAENWALIGQTVDYLARDTPPSAVQHFWAMSVQGQFYLLWVVVAVVAFILARGRSLTKALTVVIAAVCAASFAYSVVLTGSDQPVAYFHTLTRVWEFGAGGLVALAVQAGGATLSGRWSTAAGWVGLVLIVVCGVAIPVQDAFPGWAALWPVAGAVLILLAGRSPGRWSASALLSHPVLVRLGSVSYAIYLWHWPLLVFWLHLSGRGRAGLLDGALIIATSIALAFASTRLVERPVRARAAAARPGPTVALASTLALLLAGTTLAVSTVEPRSLTAEGAVGAELVEATRGRGAPDLRARNSDAPVPGVAAAAEDIPGLYDDDCLTRLRHEEVVTCDYGDVDAGRTLVLVGGSHSAHWLPGLELAAQSAGWRITTYIKNGCRVGYDLEPGEEAEELITCSAWNDVALDEIRELGPDLVVMTSTVSGREEPQEPERIPEGYLEAWQSWNEAGIPVLAIRDTPRAVEDRVDCLAGHGVDSDACEVERTTTLPDPSPIEQLADPPAGVTFVDLTEYFCDETHCPAVIGDTIVYSDRNHITASYSRSLAWALERMLDEVAS